MRLVHMPVAKLGGFIVLQAEMNAKRNIRIFKRVGEVEVGRSVVNRVTAENDEQINLARTHIHEQSSFRSRCGCR